MLPIKKYDEKEFFSIKSACSISARILDELTNYIKPGLSTHDLDKICHGLIIKENAKPAYFKGYPKTIFTSINSVVRGVPSSNDVLKEGDIINIDIAIYFDGFYGSTSRMYYVGRKIPRVAQLLCERTAKSLELAIDTICPGRTVDTVIETIKKNIEPYGYSFVSHGLKNINVDDVFCEDNLNGALEEGMIFMLSPIINLSSKETSTLKDGWSVITKDQRLSAHFSHCIGVIKDGCEVFTRSHYPTQAVILR